MARLWRGSHETMEGLPPYQREWVGRVAWLIGANLTERSAPVLGRSIVETGKDVGIFAAPLVSGTAAPEDGRTPPLLVQLS